MRLEKRLLVAFLSSACSNHSLWATASAGGNPGGHGYQTHGYMQQQGSNWGSNEGSYSQPNDRAAPPPLPAGWSEHFDPSSGQPYYYNAADGTTTWDRPQVVVAEDINESKEDATPEYSNFSGEEKRPSLDSDFSNEAEVTDEKPAQESENEPTFRDYSALGAREGQTSDLGSGDQPISEQKPQETQQSSQRPWGVPQGIQQPSTEGLNRDVYRSSFEPTSSNQYQNNNAHQTGQEQFSNRRPEQRQFEPSGPSTQETEIDARVKPFGQGPGQVLGQPPQQRDKYQSVHQGSHSAPRRPTFQEETSPKEEEKKDLELPPRSFAQRHQQQQTEPESISQRPLQSQPVASANITQTEAPRFSQASGPAFVPRQPVPGAPLRPQPTTFQRDQGYPSGGQHHGERVNNEQLQRTTPPPQQQQQLPPPNLQSPPQQSQYNPPQYAQRPPSAHNQQHQYALGSPQGQYGYGQQDAAGQNPYGQYPREHAQAQYGQYGQYGQNGQYSQQYGGPSHQGGSGQLVSQEETVGGALRGAFGSAWQGLVGFGNRTMTAVESAKNTVVSGAREATQTISSTSSNLLTQAKGTLSSVFEGGSESAVDQYSLTGRYGAPPASGYGAQSQGQPYPGYPYQQRPRPQGQNYPPQGQYPPQGHSLPQGNYPPSGKYPPTGQYPPGYNPPQPRDDPPYPQAQQEQRPPHGRPMQYQWQQPPGYAGQQSGESRQQPPVQQRGAPYPQQRRNPGPGDQQPQQQLPQGQQAQDPWQHPGLGPDGY
ncbi:hypothetical protein FisN_21Lh095 [Fistulifera solaris]|uniref:WW domain-containing protein n=1 Tax=Fistulifera solaris TaxID=1519565 RepID=A0A1Z5KKH5_FISSO|nr:hypothetical protein FisN_21Lh095 [Fistulifera solaris]|eukprot:GAX26625.1 hypothetical protein FisN_21Lh095 [Fistulifera solaris]